MYSMVVEARKNGCYVQAQAFGDQTTLVAIKPLHFKPTTSLPLMIAVQQRQPGTRARNGYTYGTIVTRRLLLMCPPHQERLRSWQMSGSYAPHQE